MADPAKAYQEWLKTIERQQRDRQNKARAAAKELDRILAANRRRQRQGR